MLVYLGYARRTLVSGKGAARTRFISTSGASVRPQLQPTPSPPRAYQHNTTTHAPWRTAPARRSPGGLAAGTAAGSAPSGTPRRHAHSHSRPLWPRRCCLGLGGPAMGPRCHQDRQQQPPPAALVSSARRAFTPQAWICVAVRLCCRAECCPSERLLFWCGGVDVWIIGPGQSPGRIRRGSDRRCHCRMDLVGQGRLAMAAFRPTGVPNTCNWARQVPAGRLRRHQQNQSAARSLLSLLRRRMPLQTTY